MIKPHFTSTTSSFPGYPYAYTRTAEGRPDRIEGQDPAVISIGIHDKPTARNGR